MKLNFQTNKKATKDESSIRQSIFSSGDDGGIDSNEENQDFNDGPDRGSGSLLHDPGGDPRLEDHRRRIEIGEDRLVAATGEMPDHYIYVAYPPELKRRLLERWVLRTLYRFRIFKSVLIFLGSTYCKSGQTWDTEKISETSRSDKIFF